MQLIAKLKTKSLIYLSGGIGILAFIVIFLIVPYHYKLKRIDIEIEKKKRYMEEQTLLIPHFQKIRQIKRDIKGIHDEVQFNEASGLKEKLPLNETDNAISLFSEIALKNHFQVEAVESDKNASADHSGYMLITMKIKGDFLHFYNFLIQLNQIPYLEHIEQIRIRTVKDTKDIYLKIWIAVQ